MIFAEKKKKILTGITALLLCAFFVAAALWGSAGDAFAASSAQNGVYDAAELLDSSQEDRLKSRLDSYCEKYDCDIAIVTTDDAGGKTSEDYADTYAEDLGMSMKKEDRPGILFLIDMDNRRMQISTSGQAISYYSDSRIDHILDRCYKYIIRDDYYRTCGQFLDGVRDYMGISAARHGRLRAIHILIMAIISAAAGGLIVFIMLRRSGGVITTSGASYLNAKDSRITGRSDHFINRTVTRRIIHRDTDDGPGPGGSGGGGFHVSSGGGEHGGGGRSF